MAPRRPDALPFYDLDAVAGMSRQAMPGMRRRSAAPRLIGGGGLRIAPRAGHPAGRLAAGLLVLTVLAPLPAEAQLFGGSAPGFTVQLSPSTISEGESVTVTVRCTARCNTVGRISSQAWRYAHAHVDVSITTAAGVSLTGNRRLSYASFLQNIGAGGTYDRDGRSRATGTVRITTTDDNTQQSGDRTVTVSAAPASGNYWTWGYGGITVASATLTVRDNESLQASKSAVSTSEPSGTDDFTVRLATAPTSPVTVAIASNDMGEARASPASIVFGATAAPSATPRVYKWDDPQTVTVTGQDDDVDDG